MKYKAVVAREYIQNYSHFKCSKVKLTKVTLLNEGSIELCEKLIHRFEPEARRTLHIVIQFFFLMKNVIVAVMLE